MKNGARYVVTTHWGTFSLDEASYQDYLAGNLWVCWIPGKPEQPKQVASGYVPPNVTDRAVALRDQADRIGRKFWTLDQYVTIKIGNAISTLLLYPKNNRRNICILIV